MQPVPIFFYDDQAIIPFGSRAAGVTGHVGMTRAAGRRLRITTAARIQAGAGIAEGDDLGNCPLGVEPIGTGDGRVHGVAVPRVGTTTVIGTPVMTQFVSG